jgi:hypothetical protein
VAATSPEAGNTGTTRGARMPRWLAAAALVLILAAGLVLAAAYVYARSQENVLAEGLRVGKVKLGGLSATAARSRLARAYRPLENGAGIHGTDETWSIGHAVSHGCVRMTIPDVIDLYNQVSVGTPSTSATEANTYLSFTRARIPKIEMKRKFVCGIDERRVCPRRFSIGPLHERWSMPPDRTVSGGLLTPLTQDRRRRGSTLERSGSQDGATRTGA